MTSTKVIFAVGCFLSLFLLAGAPVLSEHGLAHSQLAQAGNPPQPPGGMEPGAMGPGMMQGSPMMPQAPIPWFRAACGCCGGGWGSWGPGMGQGMTMNP